MQLIKMLTKLNTKLWAGQQGK